MHRCVVRGGVGENKIERQEVKEKKCSVVQLKCEIVEFVIIRTSTQ